MIIALLASGTLAIAFIGFAGLAALDRIEYKREGRQ